MIIIWPFPLCSNPSEIQRVEVLLGWEWDGQYIVRGITFRPSSFQIGAFDVN